MSEGKNLVNKVVSKTTKVKTPTFGKAKVPKFGKTKTPKVVGKKVPVIKENDSAVQKVLKNML